RADVLLATASDGAQSVERLPGHDAGEVRARLAHTSAIRVVPADPRLLHDVLRVADGSVDLVRDREQQAAVGRELVGGHVPDDTASGSSHTSEYPWLSRPAAELKRDRMFSSAIICVSSTIAASPSSSSSRATRSSVT